MAFQIHISGNENWDAPVAPRFVIASPYFEIAEYWERGSPSRSLSFDVPSHDRFALKLRVEVGDGEVAAGYRELTDGDQLVLFAVNPGYYLANMVHSGRRHVRCTVVCANGETGQGCVTCESSSGLKIKVCC